MPDAVLRPADSDQAERLHAFAHDIKNRLHGLWEALRMSNDSSIEGADKAGIIALAERGYFSAQRELEQLLDDLAVDRDVRAEHKRIDIVSCLNTALHHEAYRLKKKGQAVDVMAPGTLVALGDAHWTTQILQALISNASKFSPRGSSISINAGATADGSAITVSDKGTGFTGSDLVDVFTRYAILSSRTTAGEPQARGTLARARQWAHAQGGRLNVESEGPGQGARFTLTLPPAQSLLGIS